MTNDPVHRRHAVPIVGELYLYQQSHYNHRHYPLENYIVCVYELEYSNIHAGNDIVRYVRQDNLETEWNWVSSFSKNAKPLWQTLQEKCEIEKEDG